MIELIVRPYYRAQVPVEELTSLAETVSRQFFPDLSTIGIVLTGDAEIRALNRDFRGLDKPTDVLSFNQNIPDPESGNEYIGDIIISIPTARKQALAGGHQLRQELELLIIHGLLHLAGHDHDTRAREQKMWQAQSALLQSFQNPLAENFLPKDAR
jgi:probable rRNA maturation factor